MTDEQKQRWMDAGLGVKTDAEVGRAMGGLTRARVHQIRKMLGIANGAEARVESRHEYLRGRVVKLSPRIRSLGSMARKLGVHPMTLVNMEARTGQAVPRLPIGGLIIWTRPVLLSAINSTRTLSAAARKLGISSQELNTAINRRGLRGLVNIIMLTRDKFRPMAEWHGKGHGWQTR